MELSKKDITIILADDHPLFRSGVKHELEVIDGFKIIGEAGDGEEALNIIKNLKPQIALLDIQMPKLTGLEVAKIVNEQNFPTEVILLTMIDDQKIFFKAIDNGVKGYILKEDAVSYIVEAVNTVSNGKMYLSPDLTGLLVSRSSKVKNEPCITEKLTATETNILKLIAELKSNIEIAETLFISKRTVENHKVNITRKLELENSRQLLKLAIKNKNDL